MIELPTEKTPAELENPKLLILFGLPKVGKTTALSMLPNNLIIDFEEGTDFIEALKVKVKCLRASHKRNEDDISFEEVAATILKKDKPYDFVTIDTVTALEDWCVKDATEMYKKSPIGKSFDGETVLELPNGAGYYWLRRSFDYWLKIASKLANNVILVGHTKDKYINYTGKEGIVESLDLTGKISRATSAKSDAIGFVYRDKKGNLVINFKNKEIQGGTRSKHLANKEFIIMQQNENGEQVANWSQIFKI